MRTPGINYHPAFWCYYLNPIATGDFSPIPSVSCNQLGASPNLYFVLPAASFPVYISAAASLAKQKGFGTSTNKQAFPQAAGSCVPLFLPPSFARSQVSLAFNGLYFLCSALTGRAFKRWKIGRCEAPAEYITGKSDFVGMRHRSQPVEITSGSSRILPLTGKDERFNVLHVRLFMLILSKKVKF